MRPCQNDMMVRKRKISVINIFHNDNYDDDVGEDKDRKRRKVSRRQSEKQKFYFAGVVKSSY